MRKFTATSLAALLLTNKAQPGLRALAGSKPRSVLGHHSPLGWCPEPGGRQRRALVCTEAPSIPRVCAKVLDVAKVTVHTVRDSAHTTRGKMFQPKKGKTSATEMQQQRGNTRDNQTLIEPRSYPV